MGTEWPSVNLPAVDPGPCWRRCGCGCTTWHLWVGGTTVACPHIAVDLSDETVLFVVNPAERCGACLIAGDTATTRHVRGRLADAKASVVAAMDAGIRELERSITDEKQIGDMIHEGSPVNGEDRSET